MTTDLSKADDAVTELFEEEEFLAEWKMARAAVRVALPHILDALADESDRETARLFESGANDDYSLRLMNEHLRIRDWLRDKAEELRAR